MSTQMVLAATIFVALSASAFAQGVDGVLITEEGAIAGNVTPGDNPGFPVTLSLPGLYKFASNLQVPPARTGIVVLSDDVTIDLNGYGLRAFLAVGTVGILSRRSNIAIRNGTIAGFTNRGIYAQNTRNWIIDDIRVVDNEVAIDTLETYGTIVRNSEVRQNVAGILCGGSCLIESNVISDNARNGIVILSGLVVGNSIFENGRAGILNKFDPGLSKDVGATGNVIYGNNPNIVRVESFSANWCEVGC